MEILITETLVKIDLQKMNHRKSSCRRPDVFIPIVMKTIGYGRSVYSTCVRKKVTLDLRCCPEPEKEVYYQSKKRKLNRRLGSPKDKYRCSVDIQEDP